MRQSGIALAVAAVALATSSAHAQNYPNRPIRLIVPFAAGGAVDVLARLLGSKLSDQLGQPVIVENRPGAGGTLARRRGREIAARRLHHPAEHQRRRDRARRSTRACRSIADKDFAPVTQLVASQLVLVASPKSRHHTRCRDLIARAKAKPGKLNYGSSGVGNPLHLTMEMLKHATGIDILAVPFRGDAQINAALIAGEVEVAVVPLATAVPLIQDGRIRGLGVTGAKRSPTLPDVPTVAESGVPGFAVVTAGRAGSCRRHAGADRRAHPAGDRQGRWRSPTCSERLKPRWPTMASARRRPNSTPITRPRSPNSPR